MQRDVLDGSQADLLDTAVSTSSAIVHLSRSSLTHRFSLLRGIASGPFVSAQYLSEVSSYIMLNLPCWYSGV
jgi:hypothetical protein